MAFIKLPENMKNGAMLEEMWHEAKDGIIWVRDGLEDHALAVISGASKVGETIPEPQPQPGSAVEYAPVAPEPFHSSSSVVE